MTISLTRPPVTVSDADNPRRLTGPRPRQFPIECLPTVLRHYVDEGAAAVGVPVEMIALPLLVAAGATIGRYRALRLKPGFQVLPVLFAAVVAPPGCAKSPAQTAALRPIRNLQHAAMQAYQRQVEHGDRAQGNKDLQSPPLALDHLYTTDPTMEAIAPMLRSSPGLLVHYDELIAWVRSCDSYRGGKGADRQHWLSIWSSSPIKVDRKSAEPVYVPYPAVSIVGGVQPDMLRKLHDPSGGRDGFIERIVWILPQVQPSFWTTETISDRTAEDVFMLFARLRQPPPGGLAIIQPSTQALVAWVLWYDQNQVRVSRLDGLEAGFAAKLPIHVSRLALILHALNDPTCQVPTLSERTMQCATELGEYFHTQFGLVLPLITRPIQPPEIPLKSRILTILSDGQSWNRTDLHRALSGNVRSTALTEALSELAVEGSVEKEATHSTGGRPAECWRRIAKNAVSGCDGESGEEEEWNF
jgi:hypothetical protein